ncbi:MAG: hypothetical protein LC808_05535 [Actinobacteria bacterium]|nr:hypothetical protein [Actinomycetota bacterium]
MTGDDSNRVPYVTIAVLAVFFVLVAAVAENTKKKTKVEPGVRAVVVPTTGISRTVVVAPCEAPVLDTARIVASGAQAPGSGPLELPPGTTAVRLPPSPGMRTVVVQGCRPNTGVGMNVPSAAFVPVTRTTPGTGRPSEKPGKFGDPNRAQSRVILPAGSTAQNIVVAPCRPPSEDIMKDPSKAKRLPDVIPRPMPGAPATVVAPPCS